MTNYEMEKVARMTATFLAEMIKSDRELADVIFPSRLMGIDELSRQTGIPVGTLYHMSDQIPHRKVGRRLVFSERDVSRWIMRE
jgi:hypothetical protein